MTEQQKKLYFERIGFQPEGKLLPDGETLVRLHRLHTLSVPYENTDYLTGNIRSTAFEAQFHEVIVRHRGGMCIDLNPLFAALLTDLGYQVRFAAARMCRLPADELNFHAVLAVKDLSGSEWWCDTANLTDCFPEPVPLLDGNTVVRPWGSFRTERTEHGAWSLFSLHKGEWRHMFEITQWDIRPPRDTDASKFSAPAQYPANPLFHTEIFSMPTPRGRRTLTGRTYRESAGDKMNTVECADGMLPWAYAQFGLDRRAIFDQE